jgi:hypothetical protein
MLAGWRVDGLKKKSEVGKEYFEPGREETSYGFYNSLLTFFFLKA